MHKQCRISPQVCSRMGALSNRGVWVFLLGTAWFARHPFQDEGISHPSVRDIDRGAQPLAHSSLHTARVLLGHLVCAGGSTYAKEIMQPTTIFRLHLIKKKNKPTFPPKLRCLLTFGILTIQATLVHLSQYYIGLPQLTRMKNIRQIDND